MSYIETCKGTILLCIGSVAHCLLCIVSCTLLVVWFECPECRHGGWTLDEGAGGKPAAADANQADCG